MTIGDLVSCHWGNSDSSGQEGVDWGHAPGLIAGELRYTDIRRNPECACVNVLFRGEVISFHVQRLELVNESR